MPRIPTVEITVNGKRKIVNADDPRAQAPEAAKALTRDDIATMSGAELSDLLDMHGITDIPRKLDDRRALLTQAMFVEM